MGKVFIHVTMSLDGFIARPNGDVGWSFNYHPDEMVDQVMAEIGAVVLGNRGFREASMNASTLPYGGQVRVPQFVVTHTPRDPVIIGGLTFTFVASLEGAVDQARKASGSKNVALLGASIDQQCLKAGLVDEIMIHLAPVLIGSGMRLFENLDPGDIQLERIGIASSTEITSLRFRVVK